MTIFGHSEFIAVFLGKIVGKIMNGHFWPFQIYTSLFGKNCQKKFRTSIFGHSKFILVFLGKIVGKNSNQPFLAILNFSDNFSVHITLIECNSLESNEIGTFLDFYSEI